MIYCRPYNPNAQGKVERSHRSLRQKIYHDLIQQKKTGVNWVKSLLDYMKCLNNEKKKDQDENLPLKFIMGENQTSC